MQTRIAIHDTNEMEAGDMNSNRNCGNNRKEKRMNVITKAISVALLVTLGLVSAAEPAAGKTWTLATEDTPTSQSTTQIRNEEAP